jgi:hypothetical protein
MWRLRITTFCSVVKWRRERFELDIGLLEAGCVPRRSDRQVPAEAIQTVPPPDDWMPQNADDSVLVSLFKQHWPAEPAGCKYRMTWDGAGGLTDRSRVAHGPVRSAELGGISCSRREGTH